MLPTPGIWRWWKPTLHQTTSATFRSHFLLLRRTNLFRHSLTHKSEVPVTGVWWSFFFPPEEKRCPGEGSRAAPSPPKKESTQKWDHQVGWDLSALHSLPTHTSEPPHAQPSTIQRRRANLCWVPKCPRVPPVPLCTSPASSAQALVAPHRVPAVNRPLPCPTTPVLSHLDSKSLAVGTSPRFLKRRGNLWCNKYDLK